MKLYNRNFWIGFIAGIAFTILMFLALGYWMETHPVENCDTCINGTTP